MAHLRKSMGNAPTIKKSFKVLKPLVAAKAKVRRATSTGGDKKSLLQKSEKAIEPIHTDEELAKHAGVSRNTIRKVEVKEA